MLTAVSFIGGLSVNSITSKVKKAKKAEAASARVLANNWKCYPDPWDCLPTVVITPKQ